MASKTKISAHLKRMYFRLPFRARISESQLYIEFEIQHVKLKIWLMTANNKMKDQ